MKADAITSARIEIRRNDQYDRTGRLHYVGEFMESPGSASVAAIITSMHRLNNRVSRYIKDAEEHDTKENFTPIVPILNVITDDIISIVAKAGKYHWDADHTMTIIGSELLSPAHTGTDVERTGAPFPWTEEDAYKTAMAIPRAAAIDYRHVPLEVNVAEINTSTELGQIIDVGDIPAVFPIAVSKGFNPKMLAADSDSIGSVNHPALIRLLLRLRGDWRQGIYDYISKGKTGERLLGYLQVNPATYGADWILSIISHINDRELFKAEILHNPRVMEMLVAGHSENRSRHPQANSDDGMHARCFDVGSLYRTTRSHDTTITGLAEPTGRLATNPAALEMMLGILDSMSMDEERRFVDDMQTADEYEANTLIVNAVHDTVEDMPVSYIAETLSTRMSISAAKRNG